MARKLAEIFAALNDEQKAELMTELPGFVAGLSPEDRKKLDVQEPPPAPAPKPVPPKKKGFFETLDEWAGLSS